MFDKDLNITGKHGEYIRRIVDDFDTQKHKFFKAGYDAYKLAAIIGFLYGRKGEKSVSKEGEKPFTIFASQLSNIQDDLMFNYRLIMLLDDNHEPVFNERIQKAFNYYGDEEKSKSDRELFESYTLGGIEILYEKLIFHASKQEDYLSNLFDFIQDFNSYKLTDSQIEDINLIELSRL